MANQPKRLLVVLLALLSLLSFAFADCASADATEQLRCSLSQLCADVQSLIPALALMLMMTAGVIYAGGQMGTAEVRAKASTWATSCVTGAIIGILISIIAPQVLGVIAGTPVICSP